MKLNYFNSTIASLGFLLLTPTLGHTQTPGVHQPYVGVALSWDHLSGKHSESLSSFMGKNLTFSQGRSLSTNQFNGYLFLGTFFNLQQNWFISPEWQIGQGTLNRQLKSTSRDPDMLFAERHLNSKLSRKMTTNLVLRGGRNLTKSVQLYALAGVDASLFKYSTIYENIDFSGGPGLGFKTFTHSKWKFAPVTGIGVMKNFDKARIGIEYRLASYSALKMNRTVHTQGSTETNSSKMKPRISSLMLRWSYSL
ncbi:hypothetical protein [Candidatus Odyssella acanthamoebae]|uniref:Outer membrane protein beta-barrel domain-containing protein n=1 Tax=Candidatus Odyssella acanthamoebae TaxID=91604 RepID=A0A077AVI7_9PROT|nr:hypothetical protein [Candidatus Paracaedibacter acanthamoebae]AIK97167.1 hypothetical protein ID47_11155 [Candidatus Paracaedibacter acanthamoebae]